MGCETACKGMCEKYRATKPNPKVSRYKIGQKRCKVCDIYIWWVGLWCPCCGFKLRVNRHNKKPYKSNKPKVVVLTGVGNSVVLKTMTHATDLVCSVTKPLHALPKNPVRHT